MSLPLQQIMQASKEGNQVALSNFKITLEKIQDVGKQFIKTKDLSDKQMELGRILVAGLKSPNDKIRRQALFFLRYPQVAALDSAIEAEVKTFEEDSGNELVIKEVGKELERCYYCRRR